MQAQHHRFQIWNLNQHPYKHRLSEFSFTNPALPGVTNVETAINWMLAVLYPQTKAAVANVAALPSSGNTVNDYRVVLDDGDGKAASYRWEQREGEVAASWHKIYDMDWGADSILEQYLTRTQHLYMFKWGSDDLDETGAAITGTLAGQRLYGGKSASTNLTLSANSGDGVGAQTGYVQTTDHVRPTSDNTLDLGVGSYTFRTGRFGTSVISGTLTVAAGAITDSSGAISFDNENLSTTGTLTSGALAATGATIASTLVLASGSITSTTGAITFDNENLSTTGTLASGVFTADADITIATGSITSLSGAISFGDENLATTGNFSAAIITATTRFATGNISIVGATRVISSTSGDLNFTAVGGGVVFNAAMYGTTGEFTGSQKASFFEAGASMVYGGTSQTISTYAGDITISPDSNIIKLNGVTRPTNDNARTLGAVAQRWSTLYVGTSISDGTDAILSGELLSLRNNKFRDSARTLAVQNGDVLFYDSSSGTWIASAPDTEIAHAALSGLTTADAGHTQFAMLAGRSGGQTIQGGTAGGEHLLLESTANASKGLIKAKDNFVPNTNAAYSGGWTGTDLGGASNYWNDVYTKGVHKTFRLEGFTTGSSPSSSGQLTGRMFFDTDTSEIKYDNGATIRSVVDLIIAQTLQNKTFVAPVTNYLIYDGQGSTPSTPPAGYYTMFWSDADGKPYYVNPAGSVVAFGSGSGSGINYASSNPDAESAITGWTSYDDGAAVPTDLTGGSFGGTFARSTTTPLRGTGSFLYTPGTTGEGVAFTITPDLADYGHVQEISFDFRYVTASAAEGDYTVWVYAVTSGVLIQPTPYKLPSGVVGQSYKWKGTFQTTTTDVTYRVAIHQAAATSAALRFDNFAVGPQIKTYGPMISETKSFTPTASVATNATLTGMWRQVGDCMEVETTIAFGGVNTQGAVTINLPAGYSIDTAKLSGSATDGSEQLGYGTMLDSGTANYDLVVKYSSTTAVSVRVANASGTYAADNAVNTNTNVPITIASGDKINVRYRVPILGWSSSQLLSSDADTRPVAFQAGASSGSLTNGSFADVTTWSSTLDTHNAFSSGTTYTVPVPGIYDIEAMVTNNDAGSIFVVGARIMVNGVQKAIHYKETQTGVTQATAMPKVTVRCNAGDTIKIQAQTAVGSDTIFNDATRTLFSIKMRQGPSQIAASDEVSFYAHTSTTAGSLTQNFIYTTAVKNTHGAYSTSTGKFTAPVAGTYAFYASAYVGATAVDLYMFIDDTIGPQADGPTSSAQGAATFHLVPLLAGQVVDFRPNAAATATGGAGLNRFYGFKI